MLVLGLCAYYEGGKYEVNSCSHLIHSWWGCVNWHTTYLLHIYALFGLGNSRNFVDVVEAIAILIVGVFFVIRFARWMFREARDLRAEIVNEIHAEKKETKL
jgi:hypothetical protein